MSKSPKSVTRILAAMVAGSTLFIGAPKEALAQTIETVTICFRGRTIVVPSYLLTRYIAAGATANACSTTP